MLSNVIVAALISGFKTFLMGMVILVILSILCIDMIDEKYMIIVTVSIFLVIPITFCLAFLFTFISLIFLRKQGFRISDTKPLFIKYLPLLVIPASLLYSIILINVSESQIIVLIVESFLVMILAFYQSLLEIIKNYYDTEHN